MPPPASSPNRDPAAEATLIEIVRSCDDMAAIADQWRALETRAADPMTYFQSFDWCSTWCRFQEDVSGIRIVTAWSGDRLVMVWPLMLTGSSWTVRRIIPLTFPHGQYGNMIVDPEFRAGDRLQAIVEECLDRLVADDGPDLIAYRDVPDAGPDLPAGFGEAGLVEPAGASAWMDLTRFESFEDYTQQLSRAVRKGRKRKRNALEKLGQLDYVVKFGGEPGFDDLVRSGVEMKLTWLQETGRPTRVINCREFADFLSALGYDPESGNGAVAAALTLDGRPIAVEIGFQWFRRFYSYLGAFEWSLRDLSPGKVQLEQAIRWCIERGVDAYDLLGEPATYKSDWSNMSTPMETYCLEPTLRGKAFSSIWSRSLRPAAKTMMESTPLSVRTRLAPIVERVAKGASKSV